MHRVIISAYGCEPSKGSEQGVGWHWVMEMAKTEELWVITRSNNQQGIENKLPPSLAARIHFIYYDLPDTIKSFKRKEKGLYWYYFFWQWGAYRRARQLAGEVHFDYCMHLTFGSIWMPTFMHKLPIPFIWGPVGGGESVPFNFISTLPWKGRIPQYVRIILIRFAGFNPLFMGPARAAKAIIARTEDSKKVFPEKLQHKVQVMLETAMSQEILEKYEDISAEKSSAQVELVYVGRLIAIKNVEAAIRAIALIHKTHGHVRLTIVGDGPTKEKLKRLALTLNLHDRVKFIGNVSQAQAISIMKSSHIFLFPSLKEGGTWSLMEAMAVGLPVICLDTSGMHVITDNDCAICIPPTHPKDAINKMADAVIKLADSPGLRRQMGKSGRRRIREYFLWEKKGLFMVELLSQLDNIHAA